MRVLYPSRGGCVSLHHILNLDLRAKSPTYRTIAVSGSPFINANDSINTFNFSLDSLMPNSMIPPL
jgi:hypothetical protein